VRRAWSFDVSAYYDMTAANAALKELYDGQAMENLVYKKNPLLAMMPKMTEFGGKYMPVPIITGVSQGRSSTFSNAQANQSPAQIQSFLLTSKSDYSIATIDNKTLLASKTDKMAFIQGSKVVIDSAIRSITLSAASSQYRSGTGSICQVNSSGWTSGVATLSNLPDSVQLELNMVLQAAATDGGTPRAALGYVIAVDRVLGTVTVSSTALGGTAGTPTSWAASDYLLVQGDSNAKMSGLAGWVPASAPGSSDNYYGVNRSADPVRLAGIRYNGSSQSIEEALIDGSMLVGREDGSPDYAFMNYTSYGALDKSLGSKVQYIDLKGPGEIGFRGIRINGADSEIRVVPDRNCPSLTCYMLQMDTWRLDSLNEVPHISRYADGLEMLRVYNADAAELRVTYYANMECKAPGWNEVITLGA
jgi:hypothetical protein